MLPSYQDLSTCHHVRISIIYRLDIYLELSFLQCIVKISGKTLTHYYILTFGVIINSHSFRILALNTVKCKYSPVTHLNNRNIPWSYLVAASLYKNTVFHAFPAEYIYIILKTIKLIICKNTTYKLIITNSSAGSSCNLGLNFSRNFF